MSLWVALHAEGVDRNWDETWNYTGSSKSPSMRRAWIEIIRPGSGTGSRPVALHAEGVDRNWMTLVTL